MKLTINGDINKTYCENLSLIFFPGEKFPENADDDSSDVSAFVNVTSDNNNIVSICKLSCGDKKTEGMFSVDKNTLRAEKIAVGKAFFIAGSKMLGSEPPWGILTGVRPSKISSNLIEQGYSDIEAVDYLKNIYMLSDEKAKLLVNVSRSQEKAVKLANEDTCSLYISIPFCPTRCAYCSFVSYSTPRYLSLIPQYLEALKKDIQSKVNQAKTDGKRIITVYIGGGTPTVLTANQLDDLLSFVNNTVDSRDLLEFTVEAGRPDTITEDKLSVMISHGVDRISINPQILDDGILTAIGRNHTVNDFYNKYELAKKYPFKSINTDLIAGLPGSDSNIFDNTIKGIISLDPENITVHTFCVKNSARLKEETINDGNNSLYSFKDNETFKSVNNSQISLLENGYNPYYLYRQKNARGNLENVGFAKADKECLYNIFIMEELHNIYAAGAGAVTKIIDKENNKISRIFNPKYSYEYLGKTFEI